MTTGRRCLAALVLVSVLAGACGDDDDDAAPPPADNAAAIDPAPSQTRAPMPAPPRTEVVGAYWDGKIAVLTGYLKDNTASAQVDLYDPATDTWAAGPPLPTALHHTAAAVLDGRLYVVGGYEARPEGWKPVAEVHSLGPGETAWRAEPPLSGPRGALAVASTGDALVAVGGTGTSPDALFRTEILTTGATKWQPGPDMHIAREHLAATAVGNRVYAIAGRQGSLESNRRSVEYFEVGDDTWTRAPDLADPRGGIGAATVFTGGTPRTTVSTGGSPRTPASTGGAACVAGGEAPTGKTIPSVECLLDGRWRTVATLAVPRHGLAVVAAGATLHVIGGGPEPGLFVSDAHEVFDLS